VPGRPQPNGAAPQRTIRISTYRGAASTLCRSSASSVFARFGDANDVRDSCVPAA
jgi:hypothetical protein